MVREELLQVYSSSHPGESPCLGLDATDDALGGDGVLVIFMSVLTLITSKARLQLTKSDYINTNI